MFGHREVWECRTTPSPIKLAFFPCLYLFWELLNPYTKSLWRQMMSHGPILKLESICGCTRNTQSSRDTAGLIIMWRNQYTFAASTCHSLAWSHWPWSSRLLRFSQWRMWACTRPPEPPFGPWLLPRPSWASQLSENHLQWRQIEACALCAFFFNATCKLNQYWNKSCLWIK